MTTDTCEGLLHTLVTSDGTDYFTLCRKHTGELREKEGVFAYIVSARYTPGDRCEVQMLSPGACTGCDHALALHNADGCTATWPCGCGSPDAMDGCVCEETG